MVGVSSHSLRYWGWIAGMAGLSLVSCRSERTATPALAPLPPVAEPVASAASSVVAEASASSAPPAPPSPASPTPPALADWLRLRLPPGGAVVVQGGAVSVEHTVAAGDTAASIAKAYLDLTTVYRAKDLAAEIARAAPALAPGSRVEIPYLLAAPYASPEEERLRWPSDVALKGVFISGIFAGIYWPETLEKSRRASLNAVVLDAKDYMGPVNYPTQVKLAIEIGAAKDPPNSRLLPRHSLRPRQGHPRDCSDPVLSRSLGREVRASPLAHGPPKAIPFRWAGSIRESRIAGLRRGAGERGREPRRRRSAARLRPLPGPVARNPVRRDAGGGRAPDAGHSRFRPARPRGAAAAARLLCSAHSSAVAATGISSDIEALGQNIGVIGGQAEALSPMVYPSHYAKGWHGFEEPGDHPEIIAIGTRAALQKLKDAKISDTIMRPWLQASAYKTSKYGPQYIRDEIKSAEAGGAVGGYLGSGE